ncbi:MAG: dienelactone hydrolase family protein [Xanthobacteraceae bacterium]|nr:dienelactone hydrolase family protein [Xanthobacteraceae bacterium]
MTITRMLAAVLAALFILATGAAQAEIKKEWIEYTHGAKKLKGYAVYDDARNGKRPAILLIHAREGMTPKTQALTEMWAKLGYVAFAADIFGYGEGVLPKNVEEMSAQTTIFRKDRPLTRSRTQAGWDALVKHPLVDAGRIALIGYCFGGDVGLEFGSTGAPLALNVSIHGSFEKKYHDGWAKNVKGRFLILHGAEDVGYPLTTVATVIDDLRAAKVSFQYEVYSGAGHGFSTPKGPDNERANTQSIASTARNLREVFGD